jgi:serine/threonine protein phosphatase PrpC
MIASVTKGPFTFETGALSHVGRVRAQNEDSFIAVPESGVWTVADGVGGHEAGEVASSTVTESLLSLGSPVSASDLLARFEDRMLFASQRMRHIASARKGLSMGTTVAALLVYDSFFAVVWCGDSRVYRVREGKLAQLTRDHSEVQELLDQGVLTPEEARTWPGRNVITKAIGLDRDPELEMDQGQLESGDVFVLCSDGLTNHILDDEIATLATGSSPQEACDQLIAKTLERGASDNVTVIVVRCQPAAVVEPNTAPALGNVS